MTDESYWVCPDCAEHVPAGMAPCPYCGYGAGSSARWGYCATCGGSRWEGALERCATCGGWLAMAAAGAAAGADTAPTDATATGIAACPGTSTADAASSPEEPPRTADDDIAMLRDLACLRDEGVITAAEFEAKKAEILRRL